MDQLLLPWWPPITRPFVISTGVTFAAVALLAGQPALAVQSKDITGTPNADQILGTEDDDRIRALAGADQVAPGAGSDVVRLGPGDDQVAASSGNDVILGARGADEFGYLLLRGGFPDNGRDRLYGGFGPDRILGGRGKDVIHGGAGRDSISLFDYGTVDHVYAGAGNDLIGADSHGNDVIDCGPGVDVVYQEDPADSEDQYKHCERFRIKDRLGQVSAR